MNYLRRHLNNIYQKYPFPPLVWFMIIETALARGSFFLAMPFIAIKMSSMPNISPMEIGAVIGIGPLVGTISGFYVGHLSDLFGRRQILLWALILWALVFWGFAYAVTPFSYAILMVFNGLARSAFEPVSAALISDLCQMKDPSRNLQKHAFHLRYFAINIGAAIAPILGASFVLTNPKLGFLLAAAGYVVSAIGYRFFSKRYGIKQIEKSKEKSTHSFADVLKVLKKDKALQLYLLAFFSISLGFSQIDSILALHLKNLFNDEGIKLFAKLLSMNGFIVVLCTLPILKWTKNFDLNISCAVCALVWAVGYFIFGLSLVPWQFILANFLISVGEIVIFANGNLIIESLAPAKMRGAYMGTTTLGFAGVVVGPMIGGWIMGWGGGSLVFTVMAFLMIVVAFLYMAARNKIANENKVKQSI